VYVRGGGGGGRRRGAPRRASPRRRVGGRAHLCAAGTAGSCSRKLKLEGGSTVEHCYLTSCASSPTDASAASVTARRELAARRDVGQCGIIGQQQQQQQQ
jgi:hypothetical protein